MILVLSRIATRLRKLPVDAGAARPRHYRKNTVEHLASRKILVEPEMHQVAKHAAALRDAEAQRPSDAQPLLRRQRIVLGGVPQERNEVADRGEADAHHDRIARAVDELVDRATVEARRGRPRNLDMAVVDQTPRETRRRDARIGLALPHRQRRTGRIGDRIDQRADEPFFRQLLDVAVAEQPGGLGDELFPHHPSDTRDGGKARRQAVGTRRHVTLPATPYYREAQPHQEAVAGVWGCPPSGAPLSRGMIGWLPRLGTSYTMHPLPRARSSGFKIRKSLWYSTFPCALRAARSRLMIPTFRGCVGSSSPNTVPCNRS